MGMTVLYMISGTGWLNIKLDGKMIPVCKLTPKQIHDLRTTLKELGIED